MVSQGWDPASPTHGACPNCDEPSFGLEWPPEPARLLLSQAFSPLGGQCSQEDDESPSEAPATDSFGTTPRLGTLGEYQSPELFGQDADFDKRKDGRLLEEQEQAAVKAFLVATALDVTLEWVVRAAMQAFPSDSIEAARFAEPGQESALTTDQRLDLLRELAGVKLAEVADVHDEPRFPAWWKELRSRRDSFLHAHSMCAFDGIPEESLLETARQGIKVLAGLNNAVL